MTMTGHEFVVACKGLSIAKREAKALELLALPDPPIPSWFWNFATIEMKGPKGDLLTFTASPDYLVIGTDEDYFRVPLTVIAAQQAADMFSCFLPTALMVDAIMAKADVALVGPTFPRERMKEFVTAEAGDLRVKAMLEKRGITTRNTIPTLVAEGHRKTVVFDPHRAVQTPLRLSLFGLAKEVKEKPKRSWKWYQTTPSPHDKNWVDYASGIRFVCTFGINGVSCSYQEFLENPLSRPAVLGKNYKYEPPYAYRYPTTS